MVHIWSLLSAWLSYGLGGQVEVIIIFQQLILFKKFHFANGQIYQCLGSRLLKRKYLYALVSLLVLTFITDCPHPLVISSYLSSISTKLVFPHCFVLDCPEDAVEMSEHTPSPFSCLWLDFDCLVQSWHLMSLFSHCPLGLSWIGMWHLKPLDIFGPRFVS